MPEDQMVKTSISKDDVYAAALAVQQEGELPTTINVRAKLNGHGSQTTIHKHLTRWKKLYANDDGQSIDEIRAKLAEQQKIIENLSLELLNSGTLMVSERDENAKLRARVLELEVRVEEKVLANQELASRNMQSETNLKASFDAMLAALTEQLRAINAQAIQKVQEAGQHFDEKIMYSKLEVRELKEQLQARDRELKKLQMQLQDRDTEFLVLTKQKGLQNV